MASSSRRASSAVTAWCWMGVGSWNPASSRFASSRRDAPCCSPSSPKLRSGAGGALPDTCTAQKQRSLQSSGMQTEVQALWG